MMTDTINLVKNGELQGFKRSRGVEKYKNLPTYLDKGRGLHERNRFPSNCCGNSIIFNRSYKTYRHAGVDLTRVRVFSTLERD
jgi:hypothetical protein